MNIKIEFSSASLFGSTEPDDYDEQACIDNYRQAVICHLYDEYPNADIEVVCGIIDRTSVNGMTDHDEVAYVNAILETVFNGDDWLEGKADE